LTQRKENKKKKKKPAASSGGEKKGEGRRVRPLRHGKRTPFHSRKRSTGFAEGKGEKFIITRTRAGSF